MKQFLRVVYSISALFISVNTFAYEGESEKQSNNIQVAEKSKEDIVAEKEAKIGSLSDRLGNTVVGDITKQVDNLKNQAESIVAEGDVPTAEDATAKAESMLSQGQSIINQVENISTDDLVSVSAAITGSETLEKRYEAAKSAAEKIKQTGKFIKSLSELSHGDIPSLPLGLGANDGKSYMLAIMEVQKVTLSDVKDVKVEEDETWIKASLFIPNKKDNKSSAIAFDGRAKLEGDKGLGTHGYLELIQPVDWNLGNESKLTIREGTKVLFGCDGVEKIIAKLRLTINSDKIFCVDASGNNIGKLTSDFETEFMSFDDFAVALNFHNSFAVKGLDGFVFTIKNATFDHSYTQTPSITRFPKNYFTNEISRPEWRGVAISEASVTLPKYFSKTTSTDSKYTPTTITLENVVIDGDGLSCEASVNDISHGRTLKTSEWDIAADDFGLQILRNRIMAASFEGRLSIPPLGTENGFTASYNEPTNTFLFSSELGKDLPFEMFCAKLELKKTSNIEIKIADGEFYPTLNLDGNLTIDAPTAGGGGFNLEVPSLAFEGMRFSRESPTFDLGRISVEGDVSAKLGSFEVNFKDIKATKDGENQGLAFTSEVKVNSSFAGEADIKLIGDANKFKFKEVDVSRVKIDYDANSFKLLGEVAIIKGDEIYGKGFRGQLGLTIFENIDIQAVGVFGKKDDFRYFMTDGTYLDKTYTGITIAAANIYGLGGGLYNRMRPTEGETNSKFGESLSGVCYVPDKKIGLGFMANAKLCLLKTRQLFDADLNFEIQFTPNWGVKFAQLRGDVGMLSIPAEDLNLGKLQEAAKKVAEVNKNNDEIAQVEANQIETLVPQKEGMIRGAFLMKYDVASKTFTADMSSYANIADVVKGIGPNDRVGWASAMISPEKNYFYLGTPTQRNGLKILNLIKTDSYFMFGDDIPELPQVPQKVQDLLGKNYKPSLSVREGKENLANGSGLAFGVSAEASVSVDPVPFYASLGLGIGSEFMLKKYSDAAHCEGHESPIGANGWYAKAQAWMWAQASVGIKVKLFRKTKKFEILGSETAAYLQGGGPAPFYFKGALAGTYSVLGGLVKGRYSIGFSVGEECKITGGSPFGEDVIAQVTPANEEDDVNVFIAPQLVLNVPAGEPMKVEDDGGLVETYRVNIDEFTIKNMKDGSFVECNAKWSDDKRIITYDIDDPLLSKQRYQIHAQVSFEKKKGDKWEKVKENDTILIEEKLVEFTSGNRPKYIMPEHVVYAYPADRQYNFLSSEHSEAYVMTSVNYSYLFEDSKDGEVGKPEGYDQKVQISSFDGQTQNVSFTYKTISNVEGVKFELDIPIMKVAWKTNEIYNLAVVNVPQRVAQLNENITTTERELTEQKANDDTEITETKHTAEGNLEILEQTEIYAIDFRTSSYKTFKEKMGSFSVGEIAPVKEYSFVYNLKTNIVDKSAVTENFDYTEYDNYSNTSNIIMQPAYNDMPWYTNHVKSLIYGNNDLCNLIGKIAPPINKEIFYWHSEPGSAKLSDDIIETGARVNMGTWNSLNNHMQKYIDNDLCRYRTIVADKLAKGVSKTEGVRRFLDANNIPPTINGMYPVLFIHTLPGKNIKTSEYKMNLNL